MKEVRRELPIFYDASKRRWKRVKFWTVGILLALIALIAVESYRVGSFSDIAYTPDATVDAQKLADEMARTNVPVIGEGPLVRVLQIEGHSARAVYTEDESRKLSTDELSDIGPYRYVIERYGASGNNKRLVLTFDDGPDAAYTPELLDLLSKESVPVTFFVLGNNVVKHPELIERMVREGHGVANHSFTHVDLETAQPTVAEQELNLTRRAIRATSGYDTTLVRPPYVGVGDQSLRNSIHGIVQSQKLGQTVAIYDFDTNDWQHPNGDGSKIPLPPLDGKDHVLLLHDSGGDRRATISYVERLIQEARSKGYTFAAMHSLYPNEKQYFAKAEPSSEDVITVSAVSALTQWPLRITWTLFIMTVLFVFVGLVLYVIFAAVQVRRTRSHTELAESDFAPAVGIIVPAYNEQRVLRKCIKNLQASTYPNIRIIIVDDGSTDGTWSLAKRLARKYPNTKAYRQENAGKAAAINYGIKRTWSPIIVGIDADTMFLPDTVDRLVRHFKDPRVGAVAGMVEVGNLENLLARCQALEYATSISLERTAQAYMRSIMVVPGACGAWRRKAIIDAGKCSSMTLAEDFDLTVAVHTAGYQVIQDNTAISVTEAPSNLRSFARQRFRWAFGNAQVYWKYRGLLFARERTWFNTLVLPLAITSTLGPIVFLPLVGWIAVQNILSGDYLVMTAFLLLLLFFQFVRAMIALRLGGHSMQHLWYVPVSYVLYAPLRIYLLYGTLLKAFRGDAVGWNKFARTGAVTMKPRKRLVASRT